MPSDVVCVVGSIVIAAIVVVIVFAFVVLTRRLNGQSVAVVEHKVGSDAMNKGTVTTRLSEREEGRR